MRGALVNTNADPAAPDDPPEAPASTAPRGSWAVLLALAVAGALLVAIVLRFLTISHLWLDEALTVNIADLPLSKLPAALKRDGAPPLYYVLLHGWMRVFGTSDVAARALSGVLGVAMLALAYLAGRRLGGVDADRRRWVPWSAVLVVASSPYAIRYATEARMYMLAMVLVLLGYLALGNALVRPRFGWLAAIAVVTAALLYTQYWAFFLVGVVGAIQLLRAVRGPRDERSTAWLILGAIAVGGLLFVPWLPTFAYQMQHTGTPWDTPASPPTNAALGVLDFAGGKVLEGWTLVLPLVLLALLALLGRPTDRTHIWLDLRTVPGVRWEWLVGAATLVVGLSLSFLAATGFQSRYAAVMFPLFALAAAYGVTAFADHRIRVGALAFVVAIGFVGGARNVVTNRTQASQVVDAITADAQVGDVVGFCPDQLGPAVSRLVPAEDGLVMKAWPDGRSPRFVNWVDYADRNAAVDPAAYAQLLLDAADGHTVWMVYSAGYKTFADKCQVVLSALGAARPQASELVAPDDAIYEFMGLRRYDR